MIKIFIDITRLEWSILEFYNTYGKYPTNKQIHHQFKVWGVLQKDIDDSIKIALSFGRIKRMKKDALRLTTQKEKDKKFKELLKYVKKRRKK